MPDEQTNGWREYQNLVLSELRRLDEGVSRLNERIEDAIRHERGHRVRVEDATANSIKRLELDVYGLRIKAGIWGLLGGLLPVLAALLLKAI